MEQAALRRPLPAAGPCPNHPTPPSPTTHTLPSPHQKKKKKKTCFSADFLFTYDQGTFDTRCKILTLYFRIGIYFITLASRTEWLGRMRDWGAAHSESGTLCGGGGEGEEQDATRNTASSGGRGLEACAPVVRRAPAPACGLPQVPHLQASAPPHPPHKQQLVLSEAQEARLCAWAPGAGLRGCLRRSVPAL